MLLIHIIYCSSNMFCSLHSDPYLAQ